MRLSGTESKEIAIKWLKGQENIPANRLVMQKAYDTNIGGRLFDIQITNPTLSSDPYSLLHLYVLDDGSTEIKKDRRDKVRHLLDQHSSLPDPIRYEYAEAVSRFFTALANYNRVTFDWFVQFTPAVDPVHPSMEVGYADVIFPNQGNSRTARLTIYVKCSKRAKAGLFRKLTPAKAHRTLVVLVMPCKSDEEIAKEFFHGLQRRVENWTWR